MTMKRPLSEIVRGISPGLYSFLNTLRLIYSSESYLVKIGIRNTYRTGRPIDSSGRPIPWMTYSATEFIRPRLGYELTVFEFGSGYSTLFFAKYVGDIVSVEYDREWYERLSSDLPANAELIFQEKDVDGEYCRTILGQGKQYDIVVVDGRDRVNCIRQAVLALSDTGIIVLDDSNRERYKDGVVFLGENGFRCIDFVGLLPTGFKTYQTSIYYRSANCLNI